MPVISCLMCGNGRYVSPSTLADGNGKYCSRACYSAACVKEIKVNTTATYSTWIAMRQRCGNPSSSGFKWYGGRGIRVCERWETYKNFLADMGERPGGMTLDRIDSTGDYEPSNCRWATATEQSQNTRTNIVVTYGGKTWCIAALARHLGLSWKGLKHRIDRGEPQEMWARPPMSRVERGRVRKARSDQPSST